MDLLFAEASTATTITTRRPAARGRDIKRKQFHYLRVLVLKSNVGGNIIYQLFFLHYSIYGRYINFAL